jgi:hypothetical protein
VLIDFGIAFNAENDHLNITSTDEPIGNQFLWLPEQQSDTGNQRDPCSDVTQVVGILFFLVTQQDPVWLLDRSGRMPHRRPEAKKELDRIDPTGREILRRVFDTGFVWPDARRWQSPQALRIAMEQNTLGDPVDLSDLRETILDKRATRNPVYNDQAVFRSARNAILGALYNPILELHRGLVGFKPFGSSAQIDFSTMAFEYRTGLRDMSVPEMGLEVTFVVRATGNEIVIVRKDEEQDTEVSRVPFESDPDLSGLSASLAHFYSRELGKRARST